MIRKVSRYDHSTFGMYHLSFFYFSFSYLNAYILYRVIKYFIVEKFENIQKQADYYNNLPFSNYFTSIIINPWSNLFYLNPLSLPFILNCFLSKSKTWFHPWMVHSFQLASYECFLYQWVFPNCFIFSGYIVFHHGLPRWC